MLDIIQYSSCPFSIACILYDLIPLVFQNSHPEIFPEELWKEYDNRIENLENFDLIFSISEATRQDAIIRLNLDENRIFNISTGIDQRFYEQFSAEEVDTVLKKLKIKQPYLLSVSGFNFRKNWEGLLDGYAALPRSIQNKYQLLLVCNLNSEERKIINTRAGKLGIKKNLILTGFIEDQNLPAIYKGAECFIFPSLYEGFGIPIVESLSQGCPVAVADNSSLPEVAGPFGKKFDAKDPTSISKAIQEILSEKENLNTEELKQYATKFKWTTIADNFDQALKQYHSNLSQIDSPDSNEQKQIDTSILEISDSDGVIDWKKHFSPQTLTSNFSKSNQFNLTFLNAFDHPKKISQLIKLLNKDSEINLKLILAGEIKNSEQLQNLYQIQAKLNLEDNLLFNPLASLEDLIELSQISDCMFLPDDNALLSNAVFYTGCPIIIVESDTTYQFDENLVFRFSSEMDLISQLELLLDRIHKQPEIIQHQRQQISAHINSI